MPLTNRDDIENLHRRLLELTLQEAPIETILDALVDALHQSSHGVLPCSILLTDEQQAQLHHGAAVGLPDSYIKAIDGLDLGPCAGSCGTAAFRGEAVHVENILEDPLWADFRDLARPLNLAACWSNPIIASDGRVLGTFAIYSPDPRLPTEQECRFLELIARTTALILERYAAQNALTEQKRLLETLKRIGDGVMAELDLDALVQMVTDAGVELTGARFGAFFYNTSDNGGEKYMLYTLSGLPQSAFDDFEMPRKTEIFAPTFDGTGIMRSSDITRDPRYGRNAPNHGMPKGHPPVRSYLAVPVKSRAGEVLGGLFFGHPETDRFTEHHERLMEGIAGQAAVAIDNAHLYQASQREIEVRRKAEAEVSRTKGELQVAQERIELALAAGAIVGTWIWHVPTDKLMADERFARAFGLDPARCHEGFAISDATDSIHPDDRPEVDRLIRAALEKGGNYRAEYRVRRQDGKYYWVEASGHCELDAEGKPLRFPGVLIDIEQRRKTETDLRRREADLALLLDATADGFYAVDKEGVTTRCNAAFLRMLGFESEDEVIGKQLHDLIHHSHSDGSHYPRDECPIYRVAKTGEMAHVDDEVFFRTDGTSFPVEYWVRPVLWRGELQGAVCNVLDISERKRAEEARQLLLRELNHRVKNLFAITTGMIQMTARNASDVETMAEALTGRLMSLARAHELITTSISSRQDVAAPTHLDELVKTVMEPHVKDRKEALGLSGPAVEIGATATTSLALIFHELATNAAKYGALSAQNGRIEIAWEMTAEDFKLTWKEQGGPAVDAPPSRDGFGSQLARLSAKGQLGGQIETHWHPEGAEIVLTAAPERLKH